MNYTTTSALDFQYLAPMHRAKSSTNESILATVELFISRAH